MNIQLPLPSSNEIEQSFMEFLRANNLAPVGNFSFIIDGAIHRYRLEGDKTSERSGTYCIYIPTEIGRLGGQGTGILVILLIGSTRLMVSIRSRKTISTLLRSKRK